MAEHEDKGKDNEAEQFAAEVERFCGLLDEFKAKLSEPQQVMLHRILWLAWAATEDEENLTTSFTGSFTPKQASLMVDYPSGSSGPVTLVPRMVRGFIKS
ncbi:MAG: hypothetical protein QOI78_6158 [Actinomycetota bacterium]|jgi:hypothetical protein|nr:hypothetical protein [Actinomycetota bacterium]